MRLKIEDIPITQEFRRAYDGAHCRTEHAVRIGGPSAFQVVVRRVNVLSPTFLSSTSEVVRFSESQYAIPNSVNIRLRTAAYYRNWEESDRCGIGDPEEATFRRNTDLATSRREAGQTPIPDAHGIQTTLTHKSDCWILCTSMAPTLLTDTNSMRASVCQSYDATTLIADSSHFAKQLAIDLGNSLRPSDLERPYDVWWQLCPQLFVDHGSVVYTESPSEVIEKFPQGSWGLVTPFVKRTHFSDQEEYRFVLSIGGMGGPKEKSLDLIITDELRALAHLVD